MKRLTREQKRTMLTPSQRLAICQPCPYYTRAKQCTKCNCFMPIKARKRHARCPIGKW